MIEFSELAQGIAIEILTSDGAPETTLRLLGRLQETDDIIGTALVMEAYHRQHNLGALIKVATIRKREADISQTLVWLKANLIDRGPKTRGIDDLVDIASKAARTWIEEWLKRTVLDDILDAVDLMNHLMYP